MNHSPRFHAAAGVLAACLFLLTGSARAATYFVSYGDFFFNPTNLTINVGDTVSWVTNIGGDNHTLLGTGSDPICGGSDLPCSHTFNTAGTFPYDCTVPGHAEKGMVGTVTVLSGPPPPVITVQPQSQTVFTNVTVMFSVTATNALYYQWQSNTVAIAGATNDTLVLSNVVLADSATYRVVVSNASTSVTSSNAVLLVQTSPPPVITIQPQGQTVLTNTTVTLSVTASNATSYQWESNSVDLAGATNDTLVLSNVVVADSATYQVVVGNTATSIISSSAVLQVVDVLPPLIVTQPQSQTVLTNATVMFSVVASNTTGYQWESNTIPLAGATNDTLVLSNVVVAESASYQVVVSNSATSVTSSNAVLLVLTIPTPTFVTQPLGTNALTNTTVMFSVTASNAASYQWLSNLVGLPGQTASALVLTNVVTNDSGSYQVVISNVSGMATSSVAALLVGFPASITAEPTNVEVPSGTPVTLQVGAAGFPAPQYQWLLNSSNLSDQTNAILSLGDATADIEGTYSVIVSNAFGSQASSNALVTVDTVSPGTKEKIVVTVSPAKSGTVSPNLNGKTLVVSQSYTVTAVAAKGMAFANWTGSVQSDDPSLTFVMPGVTNVSLTANFIPSPFASNGAAGAYAGLFWDANNPSNQTSGYFGGTLAAGGVVSGQLKIAGVSSVFSTTLRADGSATVAVKRHNLSTLVLTLQVDLTGLETLTGSVSDLNNSFNAQLTAYRGGFSTKNTTANFNGYYTWEMPGATGNAPAGYSYGTAAITASGGVRLTIFLSDGTTTTASGSLSTNGQVPLYASLYSGKGSVLSWLTFTNPANGLSTNSALWFKGPIAKATYPNGFTLTNLTLLMGEYTAEADGINALNASSASVQFSGGDLTNSPVETITLNSSGAGGSATNAAVNISGKTGIFSGSYQDPVSGKTVRLKGVVLSSLPAGYGFFTTGSGLSGAVLIDPQ